MGWMKLSLSTESEEGVAAIWMERYMGRWSLRVFPETIERAVSDTCPVLSPYLRDGE